MWMPVIEAKDLTDKPITFRFWDIPTVLFRTKNGALGALEDQCGHRKVPLSEGVVVDDGIRCGFHHISFDVHGHCLSIPQVLKCGEDFKKKCKVRSFYVKEALGLIWLSLESENESPFPISLAKIPDWADIVTHSFDVEGDIRVWMDHFLDPAHCIWVHAPSFYSGTEEAPAQVDLIEIDITNLSEYKDEPGVLFKLNALRPPAFWRVLLQSKSPLGLVEKLLSGAALQPNKMEVRATVPTPFCQHSSSKHISAFGEYGLEIWTSITPLSKNKNRFLSAAFLRKKIKNPSLRKIMKPFLGKYIELHLGEEDHKYLRNTPFTANNDLLLTELDKTVTAQREMFARYVASKAHLYPKESLFHTLFPSEKIKKAA